MTKLYELSGIETISPDILDGYKVELQRFYNELKTKGLEQEAAITKSVIVLLETDEALTALQNALENSAYPSVYSEIINVLFPESLGSLAPPNPIVLGNIPAPNDSETRKMLNYFADYYRRKYDEMFKGKSFFTFLMDPGLISKSTTDMLRRSSNPGTTYSIPYRVAYQDSIGYNNARMLADAKRLGFTDFEGSQVQEAIKPIVKTNPVQDQPQIQDLDMRTKQDDPIQPLVEQPALPGTRSVNDSPATTNENKLMAFYDKNKKIIVIAVSAIVVAILGYVVLKPKKKKRSLSGIRRKKRTTARRTTTRRKRTTTGSTKRKTTRRRKRRTLNGKKPLRLSAPKMTVSRKSKPKKRKKTTSTTRRLTTGRKRTATKRRA